MSRLQVVSLDIGNIKESLANLLAPLLVDVDAPQGGPRHTPLLVTINHLEALGVKTAIVQDKVQDPDFLAEHEAYYSKWTYPVDRYCKRVHFFSVSVDVRDCLSAVDELYEQSGSYLGFLTLRPIRLSPQGATILSSNSFPASNKFILAKDRFQVNLAGRDFYVTGTPFMQQDNAVGACAQASLWMGLRTLRKRLGHSAYSPAQITNAATRFLVRGRTLPNRDGLVIEQITEALRSSGYAPHLIPLKPEGEVNVTEEDIRRTKSKLYPYIESGIPVLLVLFSQNGGHAVLLVGHDWDEKSSNLWGISVPPWDNGESLKLVDAASWINHFYINNDNTGPYVSLSNFGHDDYSLEQAAFAIPFLRKDILIDADEAVSTCVGILNNCISDELIPELPELVFRVYMRERAEFRFEVLGDSWPDEVRRFYREKWLPKRFWVAEINAIDNYGTLTDKVSRVGEILLDPCSEPADGRFLSIRLSGLLASKDQSKGVLFDRDPFTNKITCDPISSETCAALVREE